MSGHPRGRDGTQLERIWRWLHKHPATAPRELAEALDLHPKLASHALRALLKRGSAKRTGHTNSVRYTATNQRPTDLRGTAPATLRNLEQCRAAPFTGPSPKVRRDPHGQYRLIKEDSK